MRRETEGKEEGREGRERVWEGESESEREREREGEWKREKERSGHPLPSLSLRVITADIASHGKLCVQAEGYSGPTAHHHLPIPRTLGLNVISISER